MTDVGRVLNVDDYEIKRYAKTRVLTAAGFVVSEASTGGEALRLVAAEHPDLVLLDVKLPDMSGHEVCRRIKDDPETSSILIVQTSATHHTGRDRVMGLEGGADAYLIEPMEPQELVAQVRAMLRLRRAERAVVEASAEWEAAFDAIVAGVALLDRDGRIVRANAAFRGFAGRPAADLPGRTIREVLPAIAGVMAPGSSVYRDGDGWLEATLTPLATRSGRAVLVVRDVTERRRREEERTARLADERTARSAAEAESRAKDEFLAVASHELRNPLNSIMGWISVIQDPRSDEATRERAIQSIDRSARAQARLVNDLLDFSRIATGRFAITPARLDLAAVIREAIDVVRPAADAGGVAVSATVALAEAPITADPDRLRQVLWNLLANAIKFTPRGGRVEAVLDATDAGYLVRVRDTGQGIDKEFLPDVFEPFRQADASMTRRHGGLGLGLTIVRRLVELHGGTVSAESEGLECGSTFTVFLPGTVR